AASVFGERFSCGGVAALLGGDAHHAEVAAWLDQLAGRELVTPLHNSAPPPSSSVPSSRPDEGYAVCHALVPDAAYAMLTGADRRPGHRLAAEWLEGVEGADPRIVAEHFRRGGEPERAITGYCLAAERALEASDLGAAIEGALHGVACGAAGEALG